MPDLLFLDLSSRRFVMSPKALTEICELGQGAFEQVLKMSMTVPLTVDTSPAPTCSSQAMTEIKKPFPILEKFQKNVWKLTRRR